MRRILVILLLGAIATAPGFAAEPSPGVVVAPGWVAEHLEDPALVILHVASVRDDYARGHIPGARYLWLNWMAEATPERNFEMVAARDLVPRLERLGVSNSSRIVLCGMLGDVTAAARVYVTLDDLGMGDRTSILDGGLEAWKAEGRPVTGEEPRVRRGRLVPKPSKQVIVALDELRATYRDPGIQLVDGRSAQQFKAPDGVSVVRGGHIPGALNVPPAAVADSLGRFAPVDSLRARFERAGIRPGSPLVAYCNVGRSACPLYVAARMLGHDVRLYDGSFEEWSRRMDLPVEHAGKP